MTDLRARVIENIVRPERASLENPDFIGNVPVPHISVTDGDTQRRSCFVDSVSPRSGGWDVGSVLGTVLVSNLRVTKPPVVGEYMVCFGPPGAIRGVVIERRVYQYEPEEARLRKVPGWLASERGRRAAAYSVNKSGFDTRIEAMPVAFQQRITRFRGVTPDWGPRFEALELFVCEQAIAMAAVVANPESWIDLELDARRAAFPARSEQHTSMSEFTAAALAARYLAGEDLTIAHGAHCYAAGCEEYGCVAAYPLLGNPNRGGRLKGLVRNG